MVRSRTALLVLCSLLVLPCTALAQVAGDRSPSELAGDEALASGNFEEAIRHFENAVAAATRPADRARALLRLAEAQQARGGFREAARNLETAISLVEPTGDATTLAAALGALGDVHIAIGPREQAERELRRAAELARTARAPGLEATIQNNIANLLALERETEPALEAYARSAELAETAGRPLIAARALANGARVAAGSERPSRGAALLERARQLLDALAMSHDKAFLLIHLARTEGDLSRATGADPAGARLRAHELLQQALAVANLIGDARAASYALGFNAELYEQERRFEEALQLARRAAFRAQEAQSPEALYAWEWQTARVLAAQGRHREAIAPYSRAVRTLENLRHQMNVAYGASGTSFREAVGPVYFGLVDVLLRVAADTAERETHQELLASARDTAELLKAAELRDYFKDDCVDRQQAVTARVEAVSPQALVVYPIPLADRLELLVSLPAGDLARLAVPVTRAELTFELRRFRHLLEKRLTREYLPHAQQLYDWLIRPLDEVLESAGTRTLVFVPDGPLRTVPMAALHDGERFLIEEYAVAVTPGIELTDPRPLDREALRLLLSGISESVAGYPPLSHVPGELESVGKLVGGEVLLDEAFRLGQLESQLEAERFSVVHVATHGEFRGSAEDTFLVAYDGRLTVDKLEEYVGMFRFRETPLELLTLSACETAAGDDRAALGLSGIAIKAGARSALGTLWRVNDQAAAELVIEFYRLLRDPEISRAVALQRAQQALMEDPRYWHPGYWSAFLLISSWL